MRLPAFVLLTVLCAALSSCDDKLLYEENRPIEGGKWSMDQPLSFSFDVQDTVTPHNFYMNIRNGEEYGYSNLFTFVEMHFPNGKKAVDTLECVLCDPTGKWFGSGLGDLYESRHIYRERTRFPLTGTYRIDVYQAMRTETLEGIHDIGIRVARAN